MILNILLSILINIQSGVRGQVVEVYLNDEYMGIYSLTECMDRKQLKLKKYNKETGEIRGGLWKGKKVKR